MEDVAGGAKSRLNALFARRNKGLPGVSFLPPSPPTSAAPLLGADHAVDRIRRRTNLSIHSIYESGFVLIANFFFLVNRDLMVRGNGWSRFLAKVYLFLSFSFLIFIRATILVEGEISDTDHGLDYGTRRCGAVVKQIGVGRNVSRLSCIRNVVHR